MKTSALLREESKKFCEGLLRGQHRPTLFPCYPASKLDHVLERVHELNEARLQRDIMPWIVPSAENLHFSGAIDRDYIGEEVDTEWSRCETMGASKPKPDFAAGLKRSAFSTEENVKLQNYCTVQRPYLFTRYLAFPFLMCEAKTGMVGLDQADTQNVHSASIATRAILSLYISTFGRAHENTRDLFGRVLVFSVSHNNRVVNLYGHYAVPDGTEGQDSFRYFRHDIAMFSLTLYEGKERFKAYAFIKNLYDRFAPQHFSRISKAVQAMSRPTARTALSFAASDITLEEEGSEAESRSASQAEEVFKVPDEPASGSQHPELTSVRMQIDKLLQQMEQQKTESRQQLEQQKEESRKREEALESRLDQMMALLSKSGT